MKTTVLRLVLLMVILMAAAPAAWGKKQGRNLIGSRHGQGVKADATAFRHGVEVQVKGEEKQVFVVV